jgi:hypothetical protein
VSVVTAQEVKDILRISSTEYDDAINTFIPYVEEDVIEHLGHAFQDKYVYRESATALEFVRDTSTADYITDTDAEFVEKGFLSGMDIVVEGGSANVGLYHVSSASTGRLKLQESGILIDQDQDDTKDDNLIGNIKISRVHWPNALKLPVAKMVWHLIDNSQPSDVQSETIDDYSVTYAGSNAYPERVVKMLDKWKRPDFG